MPSLSIVIPTRGDFEGIGCNEVLNLQGDLEIVIAHPPGTSIPEIDDPRVKQVIAPLRGEVLQRATAILNTSGKYVLSLDQDQVVHPDIVNIVEGYFERFPESWVLRSVKGKISASEYSVEACSWAPAEVFHKLKSGQVRSEEVMIEVPIAPFDKVRFDIRHLFMPLLPRKDQHGRHVENFNLKVWRGDLVRQAVEDMSTAFSVFGALKYLPFWCMDRLLGLYLQALFFVPGKIVGHWTLQPLLYCVEDDMQLDRKGRFYLAADMVLLRRFPGYGYFWNLFFAGFWGLMMRVAKRVFNLLGDIVEKKGNSKGK